MSSNSYFQNFINDGSLENGQPIPESQVIGLVEDLSSTGTGLLVRQNNPDLQLDASKIVSGQIAIARLASGAPNGSQFIRDDGVLAVPSGGGGSVGPGISNLAIVTKTANYTATVNDFTILADATSGAVTITLPLAPVAQQIFNIKAINVTNTVTVAGNGKTIDGSSSAQLKVINACITVQYDGTAWRII